MSDTDWRDRAACRDEDPDLFFPVGTGAAAMRQADKAKAICQEKCKVRDACARHALRTQTADGVHGGFLLPTQRKSLRRYVERVDQVQSEMYTTTCPRCGKEMESRVRLVVCGSCRAHDRHQSVPAAPVREHLEALRTRGWTLRAIYTTAGVSQTVASRIACGRVETCSGRAAAKLLAVQGKPPERLPGVCPVCEKDLPITGTSDKCGHRGYCSKKCRADREAVSA